MWKHNVVWILFYLESGFSARLTGEDALIAVCALLLTGPSVRSQQGDYS